MLESADLAQQAQEDGFREIQLNGKQLVFLFMAATVMSVVIFLCGVLVGRGVRAERVAAMAEASNLGVVPPADAPAVASPAPVAPAGSDPTKAPPPPAVDDLSYFDRLGKPGTPAEELKAEPAAAPPAVAKVEKVEKAPAEAPAPPVNKAPERVASSAPTAAATQTPAAASADTAEPAGSGFAVQIAALNVRSEADAIARRLSGKGYRAYVVAPANGTSMFRVRVGKFASRREAESVAARLQKEEQFKPWITR